MISDNSVTQTLMPVGKILTNDSSTIKLTNVESVGYPMGIKIVTFVSICLIA